MGYFKINRNDRKENRENLAQTAEFLREALMRHANGNGQKFRVEGKTLVCQTLSGQEPVFMIMVRPQAVAFENFQSPLAEKCVRILQEQKIIAPY